MSEEDTVTEMRKELGEKAGRSGDNLHKEASREFSESYRRGFLGFGSNVAPKNFGKGAGETRTWPCVCGHINRSDRVAKRGGEVVCWICETPRSYGEDHERAE
jgi:hypothetical protein